ncbi:MAG: CopD family protein [Proteobacteria bacterium]|nr:CopD family protein [Pseudomonadota bacterium]
MLTSIALLLHALAATIWVGGMFFAYVVLRPVGHEMEPPARQDLWRGVFRRFFLWVWKAVAVLVVTGYLLVFWTFQGFGHAGIHIHIMHLLAWIMIALFAYLFFAPYRRFKATLEAGDRPAAGAQLNRIRRIVLANLSLGLLLVAIAVSGRYWAPVPG